MDAPPGASPGWYDDPLGHADQRYFDGQAWTSEVMQRTVDPLSAPPAHSATSEAGDSGANAKGRKLATKPAALIAGAVGLLLLAGVGWWAVFAVFSDDSPSTNEELAEWLNGDGLECSVGEETNSVLCAIPNEAENELAAVYMTVDNGVYEVNSFPSEVAGALGGDPEELLNQIGERSGWWSAGTTQRMLRTRALDGTQTEGDVSWTYHPDAGLQIVVSSD
jgi:hypothetical protein